MDGFSLGTVFPGQPGLAGLQWGDLEPESDQEFWGRGEGEQKAGAQRQKAWGAPKASFWHFPLAWTAISMCRKEIISDAKLSTCPRLLRIGQRFPRSR